MTKLNPDALESPAPRSVEQAAPVEVAEVLARLRDRADVPAQGAETEATLRDAITLIEAQSATIAQLQGEVERLTCDKITLEASEQRLRGWAYAPDGVLYKAHYNDAAARLQAAEERADKAGRFVLWALKSGPWEGQDLDGFDVQEKAEECGLLVKVPYDPEKHGESEFDIEPGDDWYVPADWLAALPESAPKESPPKP